MRITYIETSSLTNELLRAAAGAAPNCVGYPDGVPESWRDDSPAVASQWEPDGGPIDMGVLTVGVSLPQRVPESSSVINNLVRLQLSRFEFESSRHARIKNVSASPVLEMRDDDEPADWPDERGDDEC